mmetsp:Transcript_41217/g.104455  ORF Transcript_41217/g.104455 Transcript_41217/m.104455 type:complete len:106 (-) Transcript_41217:208-525(-)
MSGMRDLKLSANQLTGSIPEQWSAMASLANLDLSANKLNSTVLPQSFENVQVNTSEQDASGSGGSAFPIWAIVVIVLVVWCSPLAATGIWATTRCRGRSPRIGVR